MFLIAITAARFGVWVADLSVTQILQAGWVEMSLDVLFFMIYDLWCPQEGVDEQFRGTVGGVQNSLNSILETVKYLLVIVLPDEDTYGYLVLASVATILVGTLFYVVYAFRNWQGTTLLKDAEVHSLASSTRSDGNTSTGGTDGQRGAAASI